LPSARVWGIVLQRQRKTLRYILAHRELQDVCQWLLLTRDAHGVYGPLGFAPVSRPQDRLEMRGARPER